MLRRAMQAVIIAQKIDHFPVFGRERDAEIRRRFPGDVLRPLVQSEQIARRIFLDRTFANNKLHDVRHV